jgi:hypothetical protein
MNLKIGQEIDGRTIDRITMDKDTRDMTVWFDKDYPDDGVIVVRHNESIDKVLNHKWETQDADKI